MDAIGGQMNAFTAKECTCYYAKVMDEHFEKGMDLLSDLLLNAKLDPAEFEKERGVILEEIAMVEDTPEDLVHDLLSAAHYEGQALAMPILGTAAHIRDVSPGMLSQFRATHYRPDNTVLAVAGNYSLEALRELAQSYLGGWVSKHQPEPMRMPEGYAPGSCNRNKDIEQTHICLGFPGVAQGSPAIYGLSILNNLFGGGMSSRLFQRIREESGMAYAVYSYPTVYPGSGLFTVYAGTSAQHVGAVAKMLREEVTRVLEDGMTSEEFTKAREQLKGGYILGLESASSHMSHIGRSELLLRRVQSEDEVIEKINVVTLDDAMRVARMLLDGPNAASVVGREVDKIPEESLLWGK
jgi:predicted Zn-dependent peptidase